MPNNSGRNRIERGRPLLPITTTEKHMKHAMANQRVKGRRPGECSMAAAAVVVTVIVGEVVVGVPVAVIDEGVNRQLAAVGSPEHVRVMVPLNPVEVDTETEVEPDDPGAEIATRD